MIFSFPEVILTEMCTILILRKLCRLSFAKDTCLLNEVFALLQWRWCLRCEGFVLRLYVVLSVLVFSKGNLDFSCCLLVVVMVLFECK